MSTKGLRKNLGTVVECSENVDDCASLLVDEKKNVEDAEKKDSSGSLNLSETPELQGSVLESIKEPSVTTDFPDASQPLSETNDFLKDNNASHVQKGVNAKRKGPFANSRLNIITFLNNLAAPKGDSRNSTNEQTANRIEQLLAEASNSTSTNTISMSSTKKRDSSVSTAAAEQAFGKEFMDECSSLSVKLTTSQPSLSLGDLDSMNGDKPTNSDKPNGKKSRDCPLCFSRLPTSNFPRLINCSHRSCRNCLVKYLQIEIMESRVMITCPECNELLHPADIYALLCKNAQLIEKYESFSIRRVLLADPDTRWCPAPDCTYAVIATSCAACPQLKCERPGCGTLFCYHCKGVWHANQTCDEARRERGNMYRGAHLPTSISSNGSLGQLQFTNTSIDRDNLLKPGDIKACPRCRTLIVKMNDGSCNHMVCAICSAEFCWLCLKEISDLHYLSPTGCTFWGKKPWTKKKKLLWQIGTLIGAPVGIALIAGLAVPGIIFGVPVFVGRKAYQRFAHAGKGKRRFITAMSVLGSLIVSPVLAVMAVGVGVPIMLAYVYGVVPLSLCRNGSCGGSDNKEPGYGEGEIDDEIANLTSAYMAENEKSRLLRQTGGPDSDRQLDGTSVITGMSVNSGLSAGLNSKGGSRLQVQAELSKRRHSVESGITSLGEKCNYEEASTKAMAGSQYYNDDKSVHTVGSGGQYEGVSYCEEIASTKALAGSVLDTKSLTDSACGRLANCSMANASSSAYSTQRDMSPTSMEDQPCSSGLQTFQHYERKIGLKSNSIPSEETIGCNLENRKSRFTSRTKSKSPSNSQIHFSNIVLTNEELEIVNKSANSVTSGRLAGFNTRTSTSSEPAEQNESNDPYKIRTLMDNLKQIVNDDVAENENLAKPRPKLTKKGRNVRAQIVRTGSSKSYPMSLKKSENRSEDTDDLCETTSTVNQALLGASSSASGRPSSASSNAESSSVCDSTSTESSTVSNQRASRKSNFFSRLFRKKRT